MDDEIRHDPAMREVARLLAVWAIRCARKERDGVSDDKPMKGKEQTEYGTTDVAWGGANSSFMGAGSSGPALTEND